MTKSEQEVIKKAHDWLMEVKGEDANMTSKIFYVLGLLESLLMFEPTE